MRNFDQAATAGGGNTVKRRRLLRPHLYDSNRSKTPMVDFMKIARLAEAENLLRQFNTCLSLQEMTQLLANGTEL